MKRIIIRMMPLALFAALAIFLWKGLSLNPQNLPSPYLDKHLPNFQLPLLNKTNANDKFTPLTMRDNVVLLNVWASWCSACIEEQVFLLQLAREGVMIYGLNYKDQTDSARHWLKEWGNPYRAIGEDKNGRVAIDLGVYGAPETFLIDKQGVVIYRHAGVLNKEIWQNEFLLRIKQLNKASVDKSSLEDKNAGISQIDSPIALNAQQNNINYQSQTKDLNNSSVTIYPFDSPQKTAQFKHLLYDLRCPVCQNQDLAESNAALAKDLRQEVYQFVADGKTDDEIVLYLTARYGDFILFKPPVKAITLLLWFGPFLLIIGGLVVFYRTIKRDKHV